MKFISLRYLLPGLLISLISCSGPRIHIPSNYETKAVFHGEEEINLGPREISDAGDLADEFPDEKTINHRIRVTVDFLYNDKFDSLEYIKAFHESNQRSDSALREERRSLNRSRSAELTERPIPDGRVFMNTSYEYDMQTIRDFVDEPIVIHYNSMVAVNRFSANIDNSSVVLKKRDESNDGNTYFKTDSRYKVYDLNLPVRGTEVSYDYTEECRDARFNSVLYIPEDHFTSKKIIRIALQNFIEFDVIEKNFEGLTYTKDTVMDYPKSGPAVKTSYLQYTFKRVQPYQNYSSDRGPSYNFPLLYFHFKKAGKEDKKYPIAETTRDLYNWYRLVSSNLGEDTSVYASFTRKLVENKKTDEEKIKTVFYWIQDNIRYIAFEDGIAGFRPDACSEVFRKRYGDCKGMANLTKQMLKVLGYDARMVWIGTRHQNFSYDIPGLPVDNHAICAVKLDGKFIFLDGTENFIPMYDYANRIQGRQCIVENDTGFYIERIPEWDYNHNEEKSEIRVRLEGTNLAGQATHTYKGESKLSLIRSFNYLKSQNKEEVLYNYLCKRNPFFRVSNIVSTDLKNRDIDPVLNYDLNFGGHVIRANDQIYVNLDWEREFEHLSFDEDRRVDLDFGSKLCTRRTVVLELDANKQVVSLPVPVYIDNPFYTFRLEIKRSGNTLVYTKEILTKKDYIPVDMLKQFETDCSKLTSFYNTYIILK